MHYLQGQKQWLLLSILNSHVRFEVRCSAWMACHAVSVYAWFCWRFALWGLQWLLLSTVKSHVPHMMCAVK
jgi:hypothetical protein